MTRRNAPTTTAATTEAAPAAAPAAPAPAATTAAAAAILAAVTAADATADSVTEAVTAAVRPMNDATRRVVLAALVTEAAMLTGHGPAALAAVMAAPRGRDPREAAAAVLADVMATAAAVLAAAVAAGVAASWPEAAPAVTEAAAARAEKLMARGTGATDTREQKNRTLAALVAAGVTTLTLTPRGGGKVVTASVTADGLTVGKVTYASISAAARAALPAASANGWVEWHAPDGRTAAVVVDTATA